MLHKAIQNRWCRLALAVAATLLYAIGVNWFIVPMGLYTGGLLGFCQVARTLIVEALGLSPNVDFSGVLYLAANVPILLLAWQALGRGFLVRTAVCTVTSSLFLSLVPPPAAAAGGGDADELRARRHPRRLLARHRAHLRLLDRRAGHPRTVARQEGQGLQRGALQPELQRAALHALRGPLRSARGDLIPSFIRCSARSSSTAGHQQNITEQVLIFTKDEDPELPRNIMARLGRGVTYWEGKGAYTGEDPARAVRVCLQI